MIKFLKDHNEYKEGDKVADHPNADYLISLGVAEEVKEKKEKIDTKEKVEKNANGTNKKA